MVVKEALANGRLTSRDETVATRLGRWFPGTPPDAGALAAALTQSWADVVLSGASTLDQLTSNLGALEVAAPSELPSMAEDPDVYWWRQNRLSWT